jgi:hypothetical protein
MHPLHIMRRLLLRLPIPLLDPLLLCLPNPCSSCLPVSTGPCLAAT